MVEHSPSTPSSPPALIHLEPGYRLDRYELLAPYARGGMASVWLGRVKGKHGFERIVAIKTILPEYAADPDFRTMLLDEARIASAVDHPNVAQTIDVGEEHGVVYLVLEWIDGDSLYTLHRLLEKQKQLLPPAISLRVLADVCRGLHAAHELRDKTGQPINVVHRDVSPHNILVNPMGVAKLIDFGVAKAQGRFGGSTSAGIIKGKVRFMAPEQALGKPVDRRADVWSIGATLQYLLTGTNPYSGSTDVEVLLAISRGDPPKGLPNTVHPIIAEVVARSLAPDPEKRYQTAASLARAIEVAAAQSNCRATQVEVTELLQTVGKPLNDRRKQALDLALKAADGRAHYNELLQPLSPPGSSPSQHSRQRPKAEQPPPNADDIEVDISTDPEEEEDSDVPTLMDVLPGSRPRVAKVLPAAGLPAPAKTGASAISRPPPRVVQTIPPAAPRTGRGPVLMIVAALGCAGVGGFAWKLWSDSQARQPGAVEPVTPPVVTSAVASTTSSAAPAPGSQPSSVSIEDLPVVSASDGPQAQRPPVVPPRPVGNVVPLPRPAPQPPPPQPTSHDRQRNFGF